MDKSPVIEVDGLVTRFGSAVVHDGVRLSVYPDEIFAIAGVNGAGKSVLLREILLLQKPQAGIIRLFGKDARALSREEIFALRRRCGVLFQQGALFTSLTVADNIAAALREQGGLSEGLIWEIAVLKMSLAGFPIDGASKLPDELSGGLRKRAALARAIALDPEILFLDEPTSGLDPVSAAGFDDLVRRLKEALKLTVVMVTHDLDSLWGLADRVAMLGRGKVLAVGSMEDLALSEDPSVKEYIHGPRGRSARSQAGRKRSP